MKQYTFPITIALVVVAIVALIGWVRVTQNPVSQNTDSTVIARTGLHSHPQLEIYVKGEKVAIPQNIGFGSVHNPVHTHDDVPIIHHEFQGFVTEDNLRLNAFFKVWGKDFYEFGHNVSMTVNGETNTELANYVMRDGDKIVLRYE